MAVLSFRDRRAEPREEARPRTFTRCEACGEPALRERVEPGTVTGGFVHLWCDACDHHWWMPERRAIGDPAP